MHLGVFKLPQCCQIRPPVRVFPGCRDEPQQESMLFSCLDVTVQSQPPFGLPSSYFFHATGDFLHFKYRVYLILLFAQCSIVVKKNLIGGKLLRFITNYGAIYKAMLSLVKESPLKCFSEKQNYSLVNLQLCSLVFSEANVIGYDHGNLPESKFLHLTRDSQLLKGNVQHRE